MNWNLSSARPILVFLVVAGTLGFGKGALAAAPGSEASRLPNVVLRTHEGKPVRFYDDLIKDKIVIINFMYANCDGICPGQTANLLLVQRALGDRLGRDVFICSITLDPERDTPEALLKYARLNRTKPGWSFLTGEYRDIELLRRRLGFVDPDPELDKKRSEHIGVILIGNEALSRWSACPAMSDTSVLMNLVGWMKDSDKDSGATPAKVAKTPPRCPIDRARGTIPVTYKGSTYQVCGNACKKHFEADPEKALEVGASKPAVESRKPVPGAVPLARQLEQPR